MDEKINFIRHYQNSIDKSKDNLDRVLHCLKKLQNLRINVQDLQETGIGKTVNSLREKDGEVGELASVLITKWKKLINTMNDEEHKFEAPQPPPAPREKHESKKPEKSSSESSESSKKSKSSSNHHHSSSSSHNSNHSSSSKHHKTHLSSTNNHQSSSSSTNHNHHHSSSSSHHSEHKSSKDHKKSNDDKSSEHKHHKSSHHSSSSSHKTSNSHKRSREDAESKENESKSKKIKSDYEKSDKKSNGSNDVKESSSTSNGTSSKSKKKDHKSPTKRKHSNDEEQEFDGANGMGFAEALAAFDMPSSSSKRQKHELADKMVSVKSSSSSSSSSKSKSTSSSSSSSSHKKDKEKEKSSSSSSRPSTSKTAQSLTQPPKLLTQKPKLELLPDIVNELPSDVSIPDYRPLPLNSAMKDYINSNSYGSSMQSRHNRILTEGELLTESFSSQKSRTRVFSGNSRARGDIPKLYEMCLRILTENLDYVECTGGVPFDILRPALEKAKPDQLQSIEYFNPYLLNDTDILWKPHCQRKWKNRQPMEMESWREMFDRCNREDDEKLNRLTQNIRQMQEKSSNCVQKTKMAFVDTMVKAPRGIVRKQEQFGTSRKPVVSPAARIEALKNLQPNLAAAGDVRLRVAAGLRDDAQQIVGRGTMQRANLGKKKKIVIRPYVLMRFDNDNEKEKENQDKKGKEDDDKNKKK